VGRLVAVIVLAGALACAGSAAAETRIVALGDFGVGGASERATGDAIRRYAALNGAQALVTLGDNDYTESPSAFRRNWQTSFGWIGAAGVTPMGTLGNHDVVVAGGRYEFELLGMPRAFYRRSLTDVDVFLLNSNRITARQTDWLRGRLAASTARWQIVAFHHPPYSCGGHAGNATVRRAWLRIFERRGVDLVLSGHDHNYQRFAPRRGVRYVVHGGGGATLYSLRRCPDWYPRRVAGRARYGFLYLVADESSLTVRAISRTGAIVDSFTIQTS
jgi:3',5'-cyclic AMP phosphodiesterase CpdA